ncbi:MAG: S41 family peptidase [Ginsengibacter sp.]
MKFALIIIKVNQLEGNMQNRNLKVGLPLLLSAMIVLGMFIGFSIRGNMPSRGIFYMDKPKPVQEVMELIKNKYVDPVNTDSIAALAINGMLSKLDPHSLYLDGNDLQQVKEEIQGHFFGIGIEYSMFDDTINVLNVLPGGPSARAGLKMGDKLIKVGDSLVAGVKIQPPHIKQFLRGPESSEISLTILRDGTLKKMMVKREGIPLYSLDAAYMVTPSIGYIRLNKFSETTYKEFMQATEKLQKQGMKDMILDLRDNGGGILTEATDIADEFLDGEKLISYTEGIHSQKKEYRCKREGIFEKGKITVLANEGTASASEVLIGALQDWDRATIVGRRTFGKGLVQEQFDLSDGSGLRLTIARYYTPLGRSIQKSYSQGNLEYKEELKNRYKDGELYSADSIKHDTGKAFKTPAGRIVYSLGGITPDVFVPFDSSGFSQKVAALYLKGDLNNFAYRNYLNKKQMFASYKTTADFQKGYNVDSQTWQDFSNFAKKDSIDLSGISEKEKLELSSQLKILTAQQIWQNEGLFEVSNFKDPVFNKALEILKH